jgi:heterodisulfide reductase subunit A
MVIQLLSKDELSHEPITSEVDEEICSGCGQCESQCIYDAIEMDEKKRVARVNEILCQGCGACIVTCPSGAIRQKNFTMEQYYSMIESFV